MKERIWLQLRVDLMHVAACARMCGSKAEGEGEGRWRCGGMTIVNNKAFIAWHSQPLSPGKLQRVLINTGMWF